jgi:thioredoxin-like negative regulator of GroEL
MHGRLFSYLLCFILVTAINLTMTVTAHSQTPDAAPALAEGGKPAGDTDFQKANKEAVEKLRKMTPEKVAALDDKLAEALTLYYDGKFAQALPIFNSISADVETMDIMWWLGTSAMKTGDTKLAIAEFQRMLAVDPGLHRVRLELAAA